MAYAARSSSCPFPCPLTFLSLSALLLTSTLKQAKTAHWFAHNPSNR